MNQSLCRVGKEHRNGGSMRSRQCPLEELPPPKPSAYCKWVVISPDRVVGAVRPRASLKDVVSQRMGCPLEHVCPSQVHA